MFTFNSIPAPQDSVAQCDGPMCRRTIIYRKLQSQGIYRVNSDPQTTSEAPSEEALLGEPVTKQVTTASPVVASQVVKTAPRTRSYRFKLVRRQPLRNVARVAVRAPVVIVAKAAKATGKTVRFVARGTRRVVSAPFRGVKRFAQNRRYRRGCR